MYTTINVWTKTNVIELCMDVRTMLRTRVLIKSIKKGRDESWDQHFDRMYANEKKYTDFENACVHIRGVVYFETGGAKDVKY